MIRGEIRVPGDKSITHRSCMFASFAHGVSNITTNALGRDNFACIRVMGQLGVSITGTMNEAMLPLAIDEGLAQFEPSGDEFCHLQVEGLGSGAESFPAFSKPETILDCGNSGTFARLLCGLLAGQAFEAEVTGDESLVTRPFRRVTDPLSAMGATFSADLLPFKVSGGRLKPLEYESPKASAQIKSAILLAGLQSLGRTTVIEPHRSRDHSERMLEAMGCELVEEVTADGRWSVTLPAVEQARVFSALDLQIPGDFSSSAFFLIAASIVPNSELLIRDVGFNQTRTGLFHILKRMGADIEVLEERVMGGEPIVDLRIRSAQLKGVEVTPEDVVLAIDEIPVLCVAAAVAEGETRITGAEELRVKECDRLATTAQLLKSFGVAVEEFKDGLRVSGNPQFAENYSKAPADVAWRTSGDHRIAMSGAVMDLLLSDSFEILDKKAVETSFPNFTDLLSGISVK